MGFPFSKGNLEATEHPAGATAFLPERVPSGTGRLEVSPRPQRSLFKEEWGHRMKLSLVVLTEGKWKGKEIPILSPQLVIGRDPQCHLRPASPTISKRHCAVLRRGERAFVRDFGSTNGTFVNDEMIKEETELRNGDHLSLGPLTFQIQLEVDATVTKPMPVPVATPPVSSPDDEEAAALLLSLQDEGSPPPLGLESDRIAAGSTVIQNLADTPPLETPALDMDKPADQKPQPAKNASADTSNAAKSILEKYLRRPRM
jgi:pSer/pThr/pTyr-binding forkhead associated (FHA) protein